MAVSPAGSYTYIVMAGALPSGITLNPTTGALGGTVPAVGSSFRIRATSDLGGCQLERDYSIVVVCPEITLSGLTGGTVGVPYNQTITASPPAGNNTFLLNSGQLPPGLSLSTSGVLSGTPTQGGVFSFRVRVSGFSGCFGFRDYVLSFLPRG